MPREPRRACDAAADRSGPDATLPIRTLFAATPQRALLRDALVACHPAVLAAGSAMVIATDPRVPRRISALLGLRGVAGHCRRHCLVAPAPPVPWLGGLGLASLAPSAPGAKVSTRIVATFAVVSGLIATATTIWRIGLPLASRGHGRPLRALSRGTGCPRAVCTGFSTAGWASALLLGGASAMAPPAPAPSAVIGALHAGAVVGVAWVALPAPDRAGRRAPHRAVAAE